MLCVSKLNISHERVNMSRRFINLFIRRIYFQRYIKKFTHSPKKQKQNKSLLSDVCWDNRGKYWRLVTKKCATRDKVGIQPDLRQVIGFLDTRVWSPFHTRDKAFRAHSITRPVFQWLELVSSNIIYCR